jgi:hypothetical protein
MCLILFCGRATLPLEPGAGKQAARITAVRNATSYSFHQYDIPRRCAKLEGAFHTVTYQPVTSAVQQYGCGMPLIHSDTRDLDITTYDPAQDFRLVN